MVAIWWTIYRKCLYSLCCWLSGYPENALLKSSVSTHRKPYYVVLILKRMSANCICFVVCEEFFMQLYKNMSLWNEWKYPGYEKIGCSLTIFFVEETNGGRAITGVMPRERPCLHGRGCQYYVCYTFGWASQSFF